MLYVIEGPAGSGKTTRAYELLLGGAREHKDRNYILVIPEQSSITAQKDIIDMSPVKGILNIGSPTGYLNRPAEKRQIL